MDARDRIAVDLDLQKPCFATSAVLAEKIAPRIGLFKMGLETLRLWTEALSSPSNPLHQVFTETVVNRFKGCVRNILLAVDGIPPSKVMDVARLLKPSAISINEQSWEEYKPVWCGREVPFRVFGSYQRKGKEELAVNADSPETRLLRVANMLTADKAGGIIVNSLTEASFFRLHSQFAELRIFCRVSEKTIRKGRLIREAIREGCIDRFIIDSTLAWKDSLVDKLTRDITRSR
jgi:hypothetical protein